MTFWPMPGAIRGPQDLEDLATASWLSETLFAALDLGVFTALGEGELELAELARRCGADSEAFGRLARALSALGLLSVHEGRASCSTVARRHLLAEAPGYLGHSLDYRRRLARTWPELAGAVRLGRSPLTPAEREDPDSYRSRVRDYLLAMDDVARHKARRIADRLDLSRCSRATILDLAGGGGALAAEILRRHRCWTGLVVDMPEVVEAARRVWADREAGESTAAPLATGNDPPLRFAGRDLLCQPLPPAPGGDGWGLVILSNIVHAYGPAESGALLDRAVDALAADGLLLVHDFWTDGPGRGPVKAALFDLHMLVHTYQGRTYDWGWILEQLEARGLVTRAPVSLGDGGDVEDTALVAAAREPDALTGLRVDRLERLDGLARSLGFVRTEPLPPPAVVTAPWVQEKCRHGCAGYDRGGQCPPRSPTPAELRETLESYKHGLLVQGEPPGGEFHRRMLELERHAFLDGCHRALALVAGPCRQCGECAPDACRHPERARPSLEACGVDVYATAAAVGWNLRVVPDRDSPVTYLGLLLVE